MYESFYGLREKPFALTPDPRYLFLSPAHREALDHLVYGIRQREGFIAICGDVGTGKTTLCRTLLDRLDADTKTALILNPVLSITELLRAILQDFGVAAGGTTKQALIDELNRFLLGLLDSGQHAVLILDEAQNFSADVLEQIRLLSNLETPRHKLIQIVLTGQLGLLELLASPRLKQLNQRITVRYQLRPLSRGETARYIDHRLLVAGANGGITFTAPAVRAIFRYSLGVPRLINLACDRALLQGFVDQATVITRRMVTRGTASLDGGGGLGPAGIRRRQARRRQVRRLVTAGVFVALAFAGGWVAGRGLPPWGAAKPLAGGEPEAGRPGVPPPAAVVAAPEPASATEEPASGPPGTPASAPEGRP